MDQIYLDRLTKLANHLISPESKRAHEKFDFNRFSRGCMEATGYCGSAGCAIGECPKVFPEDWCFVPTCIPGTSIFMGRPRLRSGSADEAFDDAQWFFGLSELETISLFNPQPDSSPDSLPRVRYFQGLRVDGSPLLVFPGQEILGENATSEQVGRNLLGFVNHKKNLCSTH